MKWLAKGFIVFVIIIVISAGVLQTTAYAAQPDDIVAIAVAETGKTDGSKYTFGAGNVPWCAYFVSWSARQAGISTSVIPTNGNCDSMYSGLLNNCGASVVASPVKGDLIFYKSHYAGSTFQHVGIMTSSTLSVQGNLVGAVYSNFPPYNYRYYTGGPPPSQSDIVYVRPKYPSATPPTNPTVTTSSQYVKIGENVTFNFNVSGATNLVLYIYLNGVKQFEGMFNPGDTYTTNFGNAGHYNYGIVANYNGKYVESVWNSFVAVNPVVSTEKATYLIGDNATFSFNAAESTNLVLYIYLNGVKQFEGMFNPGDTYTRTLSATGQYNYGIVANYNGKKIESTWHSFTVNPSQCVITFNSQGGSAVESIHTGYNTTISAPTNPTKTGYTFGSWYKEASCTNAWNFASDKATAATTLYAKWIPNTYTIKFNINGGTSGTMASLAMTYDSSKVLTANTFKKTGYSFLGWATTSTGAVVYKDLEAVKNLTATKGATINLYAKWGAPITSATSYNYNSIKVSWAYAGSATSYKIYRATSATGTYSYVYTASSTARSWVDTGQTTGKYYYYKVYPVAGGTEYKFSTYKYAKAIPTTPTVALSKSSSTSIKVSWNAIAGATKYQIYRATSSTGTYSLVYTTSSTASSWTNMGLTAGKTYYYKVRAYHLEGTTNVYGSTSAVKYLKI